MIYMSNILKEYNLSDEKINALECEINAIMKMQNNNIVMEGANIEYTYIFKDGKNKFNENISYAKVLISNKKYKEADIQLDACISIILDIRNGIKSLPSTVGSDILGFVANTLIFASKLLIPFCMTLIKQSPATKHSGGSIEYKIDKRMITKISGYGLMVVNSITEIIRDISQIVRNMKAKDTTVDMLNLYRNRLLAETFSMEKSVKDIKKIIEKKIKEDSEV